MTMFSGNDRPSGPFGQCETVSEIVIVTSQLIGLDGVEQLLAKADLTREALRRASSEIERVGLKELAQIIRKHARKAKREPLTFDKRWPPETRGRQTLANLRARGWYRLCD